MRLACVALAIVASACSPFGDDASCGAALEAGDDAPPSRLDPETLQCHAPAGFCDPRCGECPEPGPSPDPTWATCGDCAGLTETTCLLASACRAAYDHDCFTGEGPCSLPSAFIGCFGVNLDGPIQGSCVGLDAMQCARHDDCYALHTHQCAPGGECWWQFVECRDEDSCWGPVDCIDEPPACPPGSTPQVRDGCYTGDCTPLDECEPMPSLVII